MVYILHTSLKACVGRALLYMYLLIDLVQVGQSGDLAAAISYKLIECLVGKPTTFQTPPIK